MILPFIFYEDYYTKKLFTFQQTSGYISTKYDIRSFLIFDNNKEIQTPYKQYNNKITNSALKTDAVCQLFLTIRLYPSSYNIILLSSSLIPSEIFKFPFLHLSESISSFSFTSSFSSTA